VGFRNVKVEQKEESSEYISGWLPGLAADKYVISANITATK